MLCRFALLFAAVVALSGISVIEAADAVRPNFVLIYADDLGYGDIGPFGATKNRTPHLDRMAAEGRRLTSHYGAPVCSPSRAAVMTGCYPKRALPVPHVLFPVSAVGLHPDEITIAELLKEAGYATACVGKWHLGDQPEFLPTRQGFDEYYGIPYSNDMGSAADGSKSNPGQPLPNPKGRRTPRGDEFGLRGHAQPPLPLLENETVIERVKADGQHSITRRYTERAQKFIRENRERPFFLYLPHTAVHFPLYPGEEFVGKSGNGLLNDWVQEVDWSVGQVLDTLRELDLDERTIVIFTSDNGGSLPHGSSNRPLRGSKGSTLEGGIRVPTIAWAPGRIPAGSETGAITTMMDFLPTFVRLAGGMLPTDCTIDGGNIWPVLTGEANAKSPHEAFYYFRGLKLEAVRSGPWKLHLAKGELYHLDKDIGEARNVADAHASEVARLRELAERMKDDLGIDGQGSGCRRLGRVEKPLPLIAEDGTIRAGFEPHPSGH